MGWKLGLVCGMVVLMGPAGPFAQAETEKTNAAVMTSLMKGVGSEEKQAVTEGLWAALEKYYTLVPRRAGATGRGSGGGLQRGRLPGTGARHSGRAVVVYRLYHVDEGYFNWLYMTRASDKGIEKKDKVCSRCSIHE